MSDLTPKGFSDGQYVDRYLLRDKLYAEDAITMTGVAILNEFPAADVIEVVRCKDCKNRFNRDLCENRGDNWFCGYGERRADNG